MTDLVNQFYSEYCKPWKLIIHKAIEFVVLLQQSYYIAL